MIGAMGQYENNPMAMYVHGIQRAQVDLANRKGYVSSRLMRLMKSDDENDHPKVCVTGSRGTSTFLPSTKSRINC